MSNILHEDSSFWQSTENAILVRKCATKNWLKQCLQQFLRLFLFDSWSWRELMWILMLEKAERTTCCVTSIMDPKFKELVVSRPFFFSWPRAPRAYLFRKLNSWICCVCFFRNLLLDFGNPIDKTFHSREDSWPVSENWIKNSAQFEQLTHCHSQCRSWPPPPGWTCHLNPGNDRHFKRGSIRLSA